MSDVFISFARAGEARIHWLFEGLEAQRLSRPAAPDKVKQASSPRSRQGIGIIGFGAARTYWIRAVAARRLNRCRRMVQDRVLLGGPCAAPDEEETMSIDTPRVEAQPPELSRWRELRETHRPRL